MVFCLAFGVACGTRIQAQDLVGHWRFERGQAATVPDLSGHGRDAAIRSERSESSPTPAPLQLDGYFEHGEIKNSQDLAFPHGTTITAWIRPRRLKRNNVFFGYPNQNPSWTTPTLGLFVPDTDRVGLGVWTQPKTVLVSPQPLATGRWIFLAGTYDNRVATLFIDGVAVDQRERASKIPTSSEPLMIGTGTLGNQFWSGAIGELRIYDGALTRQQVKELYETTRSEYPQQSASPSHTAPQLLVRAKRKPDDAWREYPRARCRN